MSTVFRKWMGSPGAVRSLHAVAIQRALQRRELTICDKPFRDAALSAICGVALLIRETTLNGAMRLVSRRSMHGVCAIMDLFRGSFNMNSLRAPVIGLSVYDDKDKYHYFPNDYINAVRKGGGVPILLPPEETNIARIIETLDGIILIGGGDVNPQRYNGAEHSTIYWINDQQDKTELKLAELGLKSEIPILATCRGMQIINILFGGTLHAHVPDIYGEQTLHRHAEDEAIDHQIKLTEDSNLAQLLGVSSFSAKSWHHQSIDKLAQNFKAVGYAEDGVIEAIESDEYPNLIAVQWHPEISAKDNPLQQKLFDEWLGLCRSNN